MTTAGKARRQAGGNSPEAFVPVHGLGMMATSMAAAGQAYIDALGKCQGEVCSFLSRRLTNDLAHGQSLAQCKDWNEAASLQQAWLQQAVEDYVSESQKLWQLGTRAASSIRAE